MEGSCRCADLLAQLARRAWTARLWLPGAREADAGTISPLEREASVAGSPMRWPSPPPPMPSPAPTRQRPGAAAVAQTRSVRPHGARGACRSAGLCWVGTTAASGELLRELQPTARSPVRRWPASRRDARCDSTAVASGYDPHTLRAMQEATLAVYAELDADSNDTSNRRSAGWRWAPAWVLAFVALWPARIRRRRDGARRAGGDCPAGRLALPRRRAAAQRSGLGTDQRAVLRVLVPEAVSAIDAVDRLRALREAAATCVTCLSCGWPRRRWRTHAGGASPSAAWRSSSACGRSTRWCRREGHQPPVLRLDAAKHAISGHGDVHRRRRSSADRLSGVLGPCNLKLGQMLGEPVAVRALRGGTCWVLGWECRGGAVGLVIMLAGSRASWITYALVLPWSGWRLLGWKQLWRCSRSVRSRSWCWPGLAAGARPHRTHRARARRGRAGCRYRAVRTRPDLERGVVHVPEHPFNGVGARGFRQAFPACDPEPRCRPPGARARRCTRTRSCWKC